jgi:hypothetical protein
LPAGVDRAWIGYQEYNNMCLVFVKGATEKISRIGTQAIDGNQIAFSLTDTNNDRAIYIATLPEPASLGLLGAAALALLVRRRRA